jgi:membrane-bound ClpP family serine protease
VSDLAWILWTVLGVILIITEIFTPGFVLLWFGVGALTAALAALVGLSYPLQFLIFFVVSTILTAALFSSTTFRLKKTAAITSLASMRCRVKSAPSSLQAVAHSTKARLKSSVQPGLHIRRKAKNLWRLATAWWLNAYRELQSMCGASRP